MNYRYQHPVLTNMILNRIQDSGCHRLANRESNVSFEPYERSPPNVTSKYDVLTKTKLAMASVLNIEKVLWAISTTFDRKVNPVLRYIIVLLNMKLCQKPPAGHLEHRKNAVTVEPFGALLIKFDR